MAFDAIVSNGGSSFRKREKWRFSCPMRGKPSQYIALAFWQGYRLDFRPLRAKPANRPMFPQPASRAIKDNRRVLGIEQPPGPQP
ncbi:MAG: hypothetical protein K2Z25_06590 [Beijerinckiaceae bacterium]|nr:hypothetical protein [Beijerinckiaceae bacterium]